MIETFFKERDQITKEEFSENIELLKNLKKEEKDDSEKEILIESNTKLNQEIVNLKETISKITKEKETEIQKLVEEKEKVIKEKEETLNKFTLEKDQMKLEHDDQIKKLNEDYLKKLKIEEEQIKKAHEDEIKKLKEMNHQELEKLEKEKEKKIAELEKKVISEQEKIILKSNEEMTKIQKGFNEEITKLKKSKDEEVEKSQKLFLDEMTKKEKQFTEELTKQQNKITEITQSMNKSITEKDEEITKLKNDYSTLQKDNENILNNLLRLQQERQTYITETDNVQKKVHSLQQTVQSQQNKLKEMNASNEKLTKEISDLTQKNKDHETSIEKLKIEMSNKIKEAENSKKKELENEISKNKSLTESIQKIQKDLQNRESRISQLEEDIKKNQNQIKSHIDTINNINNRLGIVTSEKDLLVQKQKEILLEHTEKDSAREKLNNKCQYLFKRLEQLNQDYIKLFSLCTILSVQTKIENSDLNEKSNELFKLVKESKEKEDVIEKYKKEISQHDQKIKDMKLEFHSKTKLKDQQLKELKTLLSEREKGSPYVTQSAPQTPNLNDNLKVNDEQLLSTPKLSFKEKAPSRSSSDRGSDNTSEVNGKSLGMNDPESAVIIKENNILLTRVGELQTAKWKLEEKLRYISEQNNLLKDEIEKKKEIIGYYIQREKLGRLTPEQEQNKHKLSQKGGSFMGSVYKQKVVDPKIMAQSLSTMQQVMEETILHNIQLQNNIKILGDEVNRLMIENKKLQGKE